MLTRTRTAILSIAVVTLLFVPVFHGNLQANWVVQTQTAPSASVGTPKFFALGANSAGQIFAGTFASGMVRSTNQGETWTPINNGLNADHVFRIFLNS